MNSPDISSAETSSFLSRLREATAPLHLALEANPLLASLTNPGLSLRRYQVYLSLISRVVNYFESDLQPKAARLLKEWQPKPASILLSADLDIISRQSGNHIAVKAFQPIENQLSDEAALGFLYVMEGSKLGGRMIFKQVKRHLSLSHDHGAKYLANFGSDTFPEWKKFLEAFSSYVVQSNGEEQVIHGANLGFLSIAAFFESNKNLYEF